MAEEYFDIPATFEGIKDRISKVGIELEGGWAALPPGLVPHRDGSIKLPPVINHNGKDISIRVGEVISDPISVEKYPQWVKNSYPSHVDASCGLHVHMSFKSALFYQKLMDKRYQTTMIRGLQAWATEEKLPNGHNMWSRLAGKCAHCTLDFFPDYQAMKGGKEYHHEPTGNRYTAINYCWELHNTLECRVLPMFATSDQAQRAIQRVLDITNLCIDRLLLERESDIKVELQVDPADAIIAHHTEYI